MTQVKHILVPVDGSTCALRALRFAVNGQRKTGHVILLLNVQPPLRASLFVSRKMIKEHQRRQSDPVIHRAEGLARKWHAKTQSFVRVGEPAAIIAAIAGQRHCTEIVMGTRGLGRWTGAVLGSTAMKLLHLTRMAADA
jgi:nucleotide-binding universal stress UspA family protein